MALFEFFAAFFAPDDIKHSSSPRDERVHNFMVDYQYHRVSGFPYWSC